MATYASTATGESSLGKLSESLRDAKRWIFPAIVLLFCALFFHWLSGGSFLTSRNLSNLSRQVCVNLTLAVGMTLVILTSGIDLSVGSVLALSGMLCAISQVHFHWADYGWIGAIGSFAVAIATGATAGGITGFAVSRLRITPFIVTLGMMVIGRGLTLVVSGAQAVAPVSPVLGRLSSDYLPPFQSVLLLCALGVLALFIFSLQFKEDRNGLSFLAKGLITAAVLFIVGNIFCGYRGIPYMVFFSAAITLGGIYALKYMRFGRFIFAIGGNREAAELSGVPVPHTLWLTYLLMGCLAGLAGVMDVTRVNGAVPSAGELAELDAIAAVVIGGTSLMGGAGSITGTLFGVIIMGILNNGMSLVGISEHYQKIFKGLVIIFAVYLDLKSKKK